MEKDAVKEAKRAEKAMNEALNLDKASKHQKKDSVRKTSVIAEKI